MRNSSFLIGRAAEAAAQKFYRSRGCVILAENFFNRKGRQFGEIDFIAAKGGRIYFVEVKARASERFGAPKELLSPLKLRKIRKAAEYFLLFNPAFQALQPQIHLAAVAISPVDKTAQSIKIYSDMVF